MTKSAKLSTASRAIFSNTERDSSIPKPVKIIITVISAVTVGFFSIIGFIIFGFVGIVTVSSILEGEPDTVQSRVEKSMPEFNDHEVYFFGAIDGWEYIEYNFDDDLSPAEFDKSEYFKKVTPKDIEEINKYVDEFENGIEVTYDDFLLGDDIKKVYTFNKSMIDTDDYFYTFNVDNFRSYTLFYFDSERKTAFELRTKR